MHYYRTDYINYAYKMNTTKKYVYTKWTKYTLRLDVDCTVERLPAQKFLLSYSLTQLILAHFVHIHPCLNQIAKNTYFWWCLTCLEIKIVTPFTVYPRLFDSIVWRFFILMLCLPLLFVAFRFALVLFSLFGCFNHCNPFPNVISFCWFDPDKSSPSFRLLCY